MPRTAALTPAQHASYDRDGFFRIEGFADPAVGEAMLARVVELSRLAAAGGDIGASFVLAEAQPDLNAGTHPEDTVSKIFRLARDAVFREFAIDERVCEVVTAVLDDDDCDNFLSQFIFKNPGAWGQP